MVQCIVFAIALGLVISFWRTGHNGASAVYDFVCELERLLLGVIRGVMKVAPVGIFCYVSSMVGSLGLEVLLPLAKYLLVLGGAVFAFLAAWTVLVCVRCRLDFTRLVRKMWPMSALALGTISSAVTLPVEMDDAKHRIGIRSDIADLLLPLGMPLNSNGAAIHLAVTAITIAQIYGVAFEGFDFVYLVVVFTLLSLANAVAPGADLVSLTMIVPQLGLPLSSIRIFAGLTYPVGAIRTISTSIRTCTARSWWRRARRTASTGACSTRRTASESSRVQLARPSRLRQLGLSTSTGLTGLPGGFDLPANGRPLHEQESGKEQR